MELDDVKPIIKKYMNIKFMLYQDEHSFVVKFYNSNLEVEWFWDDKERITNVKIDTKNHCLTSEKEKDFKFALGLIKTIPEMELISRKYDEVIEKEYNKLINDILKST